MHKALEGIENVDAIIEAVPYLICPKALAQSLSNISRQVPLAPTCVFLLCAHLHIQVGRCKRA